MHPLLFVASLATLAVAFVLLTRGRARSGRWGLRELAPERSGDSPYRDGLLRARVPLGAPPSARVSAAFHLLWGPFTTLVLAPAGLLYGTAVASDGHVFPGLLVIAVASEGFLLGGFLAGSSVALLERRGLGKLRQTAVWSVVHHAAVIAAFATDATAEPRGPVFAIALGLALVGLAGAALFARALGTATHRDALLTLRDES
ncbi:MAG: hypothetical protein AAF447_25245 [Myxococcota bacterium]